MITLEGNHLRAISDSTEGRLSVQFLAKTAKQRLSMQLRSGVLACPSCATTQVLSSMWRGENSNFHQLKYNLNNALNSFYEGMHGTEHWNLFMITSPWQNRKVRGPSTRMYCKWSLRKGSDTINHLFNTRFNARTTRNERDLEEVCL